MNKYLIKVKDITFNYYEVEASDLERAEEKLYDNLDNGKHVKDEWKGFEILEVTAI